MNRFHALLPWGLVALLLAWSAYGVWPVVPVEGDEQGVLFGVAGMLKHDATQLQMRYIYYLQPGSYQLLAGLVRSTGATPDACFAAVTVAGALGFALAGARLLQILLAWPLGWTLAAMLWCQEVTTAAFYMNTSALAGAVAILAVIIARQPQRAAWVGAGLLLGLAGWLRADSLLVAPACLGMVYWREKKWRPSLIQTAVIAAVSLVAFLGLCVASGAALSDSFAVYGQRGFLHSGWRQFVAVFPLILSPALALAGLAGLGLLLAPRWRPLGIIFTTGVTASLLAHGTELTTPKYFYYIIPFLLLPALVLADALLRARPAWPRGWQVATGLAVVVLFMADSVLGLRHLGESQRYFRAEPTFASLAQLPRGDRTITLVVGAGELIINVDAFRLRTGKWFAPLCWRREKLRAQADLATIASWLEPRHGDLTVYGSGWLPTQLVTRQLLAAGFQRPKPANREVGVATWEEWHRDGQTVHLSYLGYAGTEGQAPGPAPASPTGAATYLVGDGANLPLTELADGRSWHLRSALTEGLVTLYARQ